MQKHLWHFTSPQNVETIRTGGFAVREGLEGFDSGGNNFSNARETNWAHFGPGLIEVWLEIDEDELAWYTRRAGDGSREFDFYVIPPKRIKECAIRFLYHEDTSQMDLGQITTD